MKEGLEHTGLLEWLVPAWDAPSGVRALTTCRQGGVSRPPYDSLNLAAHVGDAPPAVAENRARLVREAGLPAQPRWLRQVHGAVVVEASRAENAQADGLFTCDENVVCAVLTADCLPLLLCTRDGRGVAALHCGWRGLAAGIVEAGVAALAAVGGGALLAWLGPAIGPQAFVVGDEVRAAFLARDGGCAGAFRPAAGGCWHADLYALARRRLAACGVTSVSGGGWCTWRAREHFFSHRRDGVTGRMATLIWKEAHAP